eukprot:CAMPEP_0194398450 /NCGR_PEP_ID=MMETSP0174-20130528/126107_1 /TAXON_ID=216777 /ORGANISM="Proboscia alata, Strain PI-D3" /LENGTH=101 /DNA_ID=CAMNT_0039194741 /DNA_START=942 /DNA_END=1244 /DNA_ORIENTATION=-
MLDLKQIRNSYLYHPEEASEEGKIATLENLKIKRKKLDLNLDKARDIVRIFDDSKNALYDYRAKKAKESHCKAKERNDKRMSKLRMIHGKLLEYLDDSKWK